MVPTGGRLIWTIKVQGLRYQVLTQQMLPMIGTCPALRRAAWLPATWGRVARIAVSVYPRCLATLEHAFHGLLEVDDRRCVVSNAQLENPTFTA
jgi:hypothetical protein